jgi:hypothetical protein
MLRKSEFDVSANGRTVVDTYAEGGNNSNTMVGMGIRDRKKSIKKRNL